MVNSWEELVYGTQECRPYRDASVDEKTRTELEAAAFYSLVGWLQKRTDVQNIDLMEPGALLSQLLGEVVPHEEVREVVYGMCFSRSGRTNTRPHPRR